MAEVAQQTKVVTGLVRFSYANLFEPKAIEEGQDKKYSISLIIPKSDKASVAKIQEAINNAKEAGKAKFGGKIPANFKSPLRDGDADRPDDETYKNSYFINANCKQKPGVVDKNLQPVLDSSEVYSGCYGRASITFYAFNTNGNKGVACGLNHVQKLKDGEPLGGRTRVEDDFAESFDDDDLI